MEPKDRIEEGYPPLDLEDDFYEDDPYEGYDFLDEDSFLEEEIEEHYEGLDDICGEEDADEIFAEQMHFYDPMDEDIIDDED